MRLTLPPLTAQTRRLLTLTTSAALLAAITAIAAFDPFDPSFDGELWGVRHELTPAGDGVPAGVAYSAGTLFVVDSANKTVLAYDNAGALVPTANDDWNAGDSGSPVFGFSPNQLFATSIEVNSTPRNALLMSDAETNRVAAFDTTGAYLFTLRLERPSNAPLYSLSIGQLAMSPGATFSLATGTQTLTLSGTFAAAWVEQITTGSVDSGAMVLQGPTPLPLVGSEFQATPTTIKRGNEHDPAAPAPQRVFGVVFDTIGNLYVLDAFNERLHVYDPALDHLFSFGTPVADGTSAEFHEPWGLAFWPDAVGTGGRLFINDTYKSRIMVYRPFDGPDVDSVIDDLQLESTIKGFLPPHPAIYLFGIALDPSSGSIAVTDFAEDDGSYPRAVVLQQPSLAPFNLQLLDAAGSGAIQSVCIEADYKIRFSLSVPPGRGPVTGVVPQLFIDGFLMGPAEPDDPSYPSPLTLLTGEVATFTYSLTAPPSAGDDLAVIATATASNTADITERADILSVADCAGETDPSTITAVPSTPPQVSGWTPVFEGETFSVELTAQDNDGIESIEYQLTGANESGEEPIATGFDGVETDAVVDVPIPDPGRTTLTYRVRDGNAIWSAWQTLNVRTKLVVNRNNNENVGVEFRVGDPEGIGFSYSVTGLPAGVTFSTATGQFGGVISFDANDPYSANPAVAAGVYNVVVTETASGDETSEVGFTWTVNHINRPPTIAPLLPTDIPAILEGEPFDPIMVVGSDPDGDPSFFTFNGRSVPLGFDLPPSVTIDPASGTISGTFPADSQPSYIITVGLSECAGTPDDHPTVCAGTPPRLGLATLMEVTVDVTNVNQPPAVNNPGPRTNVEGDIVTLPIITSDPDGDTLAFSASGLPSGLAISPATGIISGTLTFTSAGVHAVTVTVSDGVAFPVPAVTFDWTVTEGNRAPVVTGLPNRTDAEGASVSIPVLATDDPGDVVSYSASNLPPGISIDLATGAITGNLAFNAAGTHAVSVVATDNHGASATVNFTWVVTNVNRAPTIGALPDRADTEGLAVSIAGTGSDLDLDSLNYTALGLPAGVAINLTSGAITGTLPFNSVGVYNVTVTVSDAAASASTGFRWTVTENNRAPVIALPNLVSNEGNTVSGSLTATDPDGDSLTYTVSGLPPGVSMNLTTGALGGNLDFNSAGVYTVTVNALDGTTSTPATFTWTVNNINRPPTANTVNQFSDEGDVISLFVPAGDPDNDDLTFSVNGLPPGLSLDTDTGEIFGTLGYTTAGFHTVNVGITDGFDAILKTFTWTVGNTNRVPVVAPIADRANAEADVVSVPPVVASDPDGDPLTYSASSLPPALVINESTGAITGTLTYDAFGVHNVLIHVSDGNATTTVPFTWVVSNVNRAPTASAVNRTDVENDIVSFSITSGDPDLDTLSYTATGLPPGISIDVTSGVISGQLTFGSSGIHNVVVTVSDGSLTAPAPFVWTVVNLNTAPIVTPIADQFDAEGDVVSLPVLALDIDGDTLTYSATPLPPGLSIDPSTGLVTGTLNFSSAGIHIVTVSVTDGSHVRQQTFTWTVSNVNRPPVVTNPGDQTNAEGAAITLPVMATDLDGETLTYSASGLPSGLTIDSSTGVIAGTIDFTAAGPHSVTVTASDGAATDSEIFSWTVTNTNRAPTASAVDRTNAENDPPVSFSITASDPDGDTLSYSASGLPPGITIHPTTGVISGTLGFSAANVYNVVVTVSDGTLFASAPFTWTVTNVNAPPVVANPGNQTNAEGDTVLVPVMASDVDLDTLMFSALGLPPGLSINPGSGLISGVLPYTAAGPPYTVTVIASDGHLSGSVTFLWTVTNVNRPPVVINPGSQTSAENSVVTLPISASDPDLQPLTYSATGLPPGLAINPASGVISGSLNYSASGNYNVTVTASDGSLSDSAPFAWTVTNTNRPPIVGDDTATVVQGESVTIDVRANDSDPDGTALALVGVSTPSSGTAVIDTLNGTVIFTAAPTFVGLATFTYTVTDGAATVTGTVTVMVQPSNLPPVCAAVASPGQIWPPNHKKVYVTLSGITDPDGDTLTVRFNSILQDEPTNTAGDGNTLQDGGIEQNGAKAWVRAERAGTKKVPGDGRVYLLGYTATDTGGLTCTGTVNVGVPHDQGGSNSAILGPGRWNSITGQLVTPP